MINNIRLQRFRSYDDASYEFEPGVNIIVGPNTSGKTNLLEALLVVARGKSYRGKDVELVKHQNPWARLDADVNGKQRAVKLEAQDNVVHKTFVINDQLVKRLTMPKMVPVVVFEPNNLYMLGGSPDGRRAFLDDLLSQTVPEYNTLLRAYKRALAQRNALLKQAQLNQLFAWDIRLGELGSQIYAARQKLLQNINQHSSAVYSDLAQADNTLQFHYTVDVLPENYASYLMKRFEQNRELDIARGHTGAGPHREDIIISLNDTQLAQSGSRGEHRTALLTLKIMELQHITRARNQAPLLLLDDVFSELDRKRRKALTRHLKDNQVFITTTDADVVINHFANHTNVIAL